MIVMCQFSDIIVVGSSCVLFFSYWRVILRVSF